METALLVAVAILALATLLTLLLARRGRPHDADFISLRERLAATDERIESLRNRQETTRLEQAAGAERLRASSQLELKDEFVKVQDALLKRLGENHEFVQKRLDDIRQNNAEKLESIQRTLQGNLNDTIEKNERAFARVDRHLTDLSGQTRQIVEYSAELQKLQEILKSPKPRGTLGEFVLEQLLADLIPRDRFALQWDLNGNKADAAVRTEEGWLCIDSKFPLDNFRRALDATEDKERKSAMGLFRRDVRNRIDEIAGKYIVPGTTLDFAFMFVPAENVFYELSSDTDLSKYARDRKVFPVSPNTFFAYLATLAIGFRGLKISRQARQLEETLLALQADFTQFRDHYSTLGRHVRNAFQKFQETETDVEQFGRRLQTLNLGQDDEKNTRGGMPRVTLSRSAEIDHPRTPGDDEESDSA
jgi:DNA recombination protein RmuC